MYSQQYQHLFVFHITLTILHFESRERNTHPATGYLEHMNNYTQTHSAKHPHVKKVLGQADTYIGIN